MTRMAAGSRPASKPSPAKFSEGPGELPWTEIFVEGVHRDKTYTRQDIRDIDQNFKRFSVPQNGKAPLLRVPAVIGHEENQELLSRTDLPAAGWGMATKTELRPDKSGTPRLHLLARFEDVPPKVVRLLKGKAYRTVSAEVYDEPPNGIPGKGKMLRRVAFLGGNIPEIKTLDDIPEPIEHAERSGRYHPVVLSFRQVAASRPGRFWCFSEVSPMSREDMIKALVAKGFDQALLTDAVPDPVLAEILRISTATQSAAGEFDDAPPPPKDEAEKQKYMERAKKYADHVGMKLHPGSPTMTTPVATTSPANSATPFGQPSSVTMKYAEEFRAEMKKMVAEAAGELRKELTPIKEQTDQLAANTKRANIERFCEAMRSAGKILPAELDAGPDQKKPRPTIVDRLMRADARTVVQKFSENGKTIDLTELDLQMREIEARPPLVKFGERVKGGPAGVTGGGGADDDLAKVESAYETFAEDFDKMGVSKQKYVERFKRLKERGAIKTADEYVGTKASD